MRLPIDRAWAIFFCRTILGLLTVVLLLPREEDALSLEGLARSRQR